jgi:hypothetical protein
MITVLVTVVSLHSEVDVLICSLVGAASRDAFVLMPQTIVMWLSIELWKL